MRLSSEGVDVGIRQGYQSRSGRDKLPPTTTLFICRPHIFHIPSYLHQHLQFHNSLGERVAANRSCYCKPIGLDKALIVSLLFYTPSTSSTFTAVHLEPSAYKSSISNFYLSSTIARPHGFTTTWTLYIISNLQMLTLNRLEFPFPTSLLLLPSSPRWIGQQLLQRHVCTRARTCSDGTTLQDLVRRIRIVLITCPADLFSS